MKMLTLFSCSNFQSCEVEVEPESDARTIVQSCLQILQIPVGKWCHKKPVFGVFTRSYINRAVQPKNLKFWI